jgi:hypothetical protein
LTEPTNPLVRRARQQFRLTRQERDKKPNLEGLTCASGSETAAVRARVGDELPGCDPSDADGSPSAAKRRAAQTKQLSDPREALNGTLQLCGLVSGEVGCWTCSATIRRRPTRGTAGHRAPCSQRFGRRFRCRDGPKSGEIYRIVKVRTDARFKADALDSTGHRGRGLAARLLPAGTELLRRRRTGDWCIVISSGQQ